MILVIIRSQNRISKLNRVVQSIRLCVRIRVIGLPNYCASQEMRSCSHSFIHAASPPLLVGVVIVIVLECL